MSWIALKYVACRDGAINYHHCIPSSGFEIQMRIPLLFLLALLLNGCAVLDPHNIIGRVKVPGAQANVPVPELATNDWKRDAFESVWNTVNDKYYDPKLNGVDWQAVRATYEAQVLNASDDDRYWELLDKMTGELKDSHTRVHGPKQVAQQRNQEVHSLGIGFLEINESLVVTGSHAESDPFWAGVRPGMTIKLIDGEPALTVYRRLMNEVRDTSTPWARTRGAVRKVVAGDPDTKITMTFVRADGSEITASMKRRKFRAPAEFSQRVLPSGFGYIRFSNFIGSMESGILAAITTMKDTPGMIVDLRNNGGGSAGMANDLVAKFLSEPQKGVRLLTRTGKPVTIAFITTMKMQTELKGDKQSAYSKPLVILTNENSASASEIFTGTLQDLGRATVIGQRTCGCLLGYLGYADLPGGGQLAYSELGFVTPKGKRIEGEGVKPDVEITLARDDILFNRDRILEAAERFLQEKTQAQPDSKATGTGS
jgi:carboxyl-terminal processing protease